jgi:hypothetical protein
VTPLAGPLVAGRPLADRTPNEHGRNQLRPDRSALIRGSFSFILRASAVTRA